MVIYMNSATPGTAASDHRKWEGIEIKALEEEEQSWLWRQTTQAKVLIPL